MKLDIKKKNTKKPTLLLSLEENLKKKIDKCAEDNDCTAQEYIRAVLKLHIKRHKL